MRSIRTAIVTVVIRWVGAMPALTGHAGFAAILLALLGAACPRTAEVVPDEPSQPPPGAEPAEVPPPEAAGWLQPILAFEEPPPTGEVGMYAIAGDRIGPLYADQPLELALLRTLFTGWEVRLAFRQSVRDQALQVYEIYDQETRLLVVEPDELLRPGEPGEIDRVRVESPLFRSPEGLGLGSSFEVIARAHGPLECRAGDHPETGAVVSICRSPADGGALRWVFPAPDEPMPPGWLTPAASAERLAGFLVEEVWWEPPDN
jgi:hypothetical protein